MKKQAAKKILYGVGKSPFGLCQLGLSPRGICFLGFVSSPDEIAERLERICSRSAKMTRNDAAIASIIIRAFAGPHHACALDLDGTSFQLTVWRALEAIPPGQTRNYQEIAAACGRPAAVRATANAIAANPVAWLIPCHRVIRKDGNLGGYHWGPERKQAMLSYESQPRPD